MYLKSIELQGFKSFANKTVLKFNKGITGIVGPNGSGKSNVADAVRWVLGEQSAKQLRGSKMEDIIFSGTENRKPLGFAYVSLTIDNRDHKLPIDYDEIQVARRVYRSGESEYLINGHTSRLKDVQELFFDTGIGKEGYSIIGQGQIDKILSGKPEDRRELFDEAVGIVKYKKRKSIAEKNLSIEKQNLFRVSDILKELEKQVEPLSRQSEKAREFLRLRDQLKDLDIHLYLQEYERLKNLEKEYGEKISIAQADMNQAEEALKKARGEYEALDDILTRHSERIDVLKGKMADIRLQREQSENEIRLIKEQLHSDKTTLTHYSERKEQIDCSVTDKTAECEAWNAELSQMELRLEELQSEKLHTQETLKNMNSSIEELRNTVEDQQASVIEILNELGGIKARYQRYEAMNEQIQIRKSELNQRLLLMKSEAANRKELMESYIQEEKTYQETLDKLDEDLKSNLEQSETLRHDIDKAYENRNQKNQEFHRLSSRVQTLQGIAERYEGYGNSIRKIMEQKKQYQGIIGVVADIINVDKKYETAIEIALGGSIQNIVTKDEQTAKEMIQYLKINRFGRATFLPLTSIVPKNLPEKKNVLKEEGVLGIASELITYDQMYGGLAEYLLGRVVVVDHIDHALRLAKKYRYTLRIVTLDGESLSPGGSMSGGTFKNNNNLLGRHREIDETKATLDKLRHEIDEINIQLNEALALNKKCEFHKQQIEDSLKQYGLKLNTVRINMKQLRTSESSQNVIYQELSREADELKRQTDEIEDLKAQLDNEKTQKEKDQKVLEEHMDALTKELDQRVEDQQLSSDTSSKLEMDLSSFLQKREFLNANIQRQVSEISQLKTERDQIESQIRESEALIKEKNDRLTQMLLNLEGKDSGDDHLNQELEELIAQKEKMTLKQKAFFNERESLSDRVTLLDKELFRLNHMVEKADGDRNALSNYMWEEYELTLHKALELCKDAEVHIPMDQLRENILKLKKGIKALGNINLNAIEEYKEVSERYQLLKTQHEDLVEAESKLSGIIHDLDQAMRDQFQKNFVIIQNNFTRVFSELFGGGKGTLELTEDADILDAGIRIIAQPPGKKLQNMMQLSGGEKALTAIALLFAIQNLKPSPFCLLDEIEAALDDANVKRYAHYLNHLTDDTQFIIITHRRGTMNAADVLYGVTMQEKGVSALVSVNLIEHELTK